MRGSITLTALAVALLGACGEQAPIGQTTGQAGTGGGGTGNLPGPTGSAGAPAPPTPAACQATAAASAAATRGQEVCTTVVRLDVATLAIIGHSQVCGPSAAVDEAAAEALAMQLPAGYPTVDPWPNGWKPTLVGGTPDDDWVYLTRGGDFGVVVAIDARSGLIAFQARWDWIWGDHSLRSGPIVVPASWSETDLGVGCVAPTEVPVRTFDLREMLPNPTNPPKSGQDAVKLVLSTALPAGLAELGGARNAVALLFPRFGVGEGQRLEYVVLVNAKKTP